MPLYDYKCDKCEIIEERLERTYATLVKCRLCGGDAVRLINNTQYPKFSCPGFYETDFKNAVNKQGGN